MNELRQAAQAALDALGGLRLTSLSPRQINDVSIAVDALRGALADLRAALAAPQPQAEPTRWIACSDRMPRELEWVLCYCHDGGIRTLRYSDPEWEDWTWHEPTAYYVSHWMALPESPEEKSDE